MSYPVTRAHGSFNPPGRELSTGKENRNPNRPNQNKQRGELAESYVQYIFKYLPVTKNYIIEGANGNSETEIDISFRGFGPAMTTGLEVKFRSNTSNIDADIKKIMDQNNKQNETHGAMSSFYIFDSKTIKTKYAPKFKKSNIELIEITRIEELLDKIAEPNLASVGNHFCIVKSQKAISDELTQLDQNYSTKQDCFHRLLCGLKAEYEKNINEVENGNTTNQFDAFLSVMVPLIKYMYGKDKNDGAENIILELLDKNSGFLKQFDCFKEFVESKQNNQIMQQIKANWDNQANNEQAEAQALLEEKEKLKSLINTIRQDTTRIEVELPDNFPEADEIDDNYDKSVIESSIRSFMQKCGNTNALNDKKSLSDLWKESFQQLMKNKNESENQKRILEIQSAMQLKIEQEALAAAEKKALAAAKKKEKEELAAKAAAAIRTHTAQVKAAALSDPYAETKPEPVKPAAQKKLTRSQKKAKAEAKAAAAKAAAKAAAATRDEHHISRGIETRNNNKWQQSERDAANDFLASIKQANTQQKLEEISEELKETAQNIMSKLTRDDKNAENEAIRLIQKIPHNQLKPILSVEFETSNDSTIKQTLLHTAFSKDYDQFVKQCFDQLDNDGVAIMLMNSGSKNCFHEAAIANSKKVAKFLSEKYLKYKTKEKNRVEGYLFKEMNLFLTNPDENLLTAWDYAVINNSSEFIAAICESFSDFESKKHLGELTFIFRGLTHSNLIFKSYVIEKRDQINTLNETDLIWVLLKGLGFINVRKLLAGSNQANELVIRFFDITDKYENINEDGTLDALKTISSHCLDKIQKQNSQIQ